MTTTMIIMMVMAKVTGINLYLKFQCNRLSSNAEPVFLSLSLKLGIYKHEKTLNFFR